MNTKAQSFQPFVPPEQQMPEMTAKAVFSGILFAVLFGMTSIYLALSAGFTPGGSIPIAVISIAVLKKLGKSSILENNMVQTIGSAGESIASGVVYTVPALIFLQLSGGDRYFKYSQILTVAIIGGFLGILFMVPLRRSLIVREHGTLRYPEGTACAEVLIAGDKQGQLVKPIFGGATTAIVYWILMKILGLWNELPYLLHRHQKQLYPNAMLRVDITPEYLGIGYVIGPRAAIQIVMGGLLAWLVFVPAFSAWPSLVTWFGGKQAYLFLLDLGLMRPEQLPIETATSGGMLLPSIPLPDAETIHRADVKWIGVGAVVTAGIITLFKTIPTILASFRNAFSIVKEARVRTILRTEKDIPLWVILLIAGGVLTAVAVAPNLPGKFPWSLVLSAVVLVFGFIFVTASSRFVGEVGYSNEPVTPFSFTTVMGACLLFLALGWTTSEYHVWIVLIASVVCIAAGNAGATSQDLKTGFLLGATPWKQQAGLIIGVAVSASVVGVTLMLVDHSIPGIRHAIGAPGTRYQAYQASILAMFVKAGLTGQLPWKLMLLGSFLSIVAELCGAVSLLVAAGIYLPISTSLALFAGGMIRWISSPKKKQANPVQNHADQELSPGMLYAAGMVAGGAIAGMLIGFLHGFVRGSEGTLSIGKQYWLELRPWGDYLALVLFLGLAFGLYRQSRRDRKFLWPSSIDVAALWLRQQFPWICLCTVLLLLRLGSWLYGLVSTRWFHFYSDGGWILIQKWGMSFWNGAQTSIPLGSIHCPLWVPFVLAIESISLFWGAKKFMARHEYTSDESVPTAEFWQCLAFRVVLAHLGLYALLWKLLAKDTPGFLSQKPISWWTPRVFLQALVGAAVLGALSWGLTLWGFARGRKEISAFTLHEAPKA